MTSLSRQPFHLLHAVHTSDSPRSELLPELVGESLSGLTLDYVLVRPRFARCIAAKYRLRTVFSRSLKYRIVVMKEE